jgi:hypothetical protein
MELATPSPIHLARLAEAYGKGRKIEEGLTAVAEALATVDKTEERFWEAELYRLKGELTLQQFRVQSSKLKVEKNLESGVRSPEFVAEECFLKAVVIARQQQAKSLELRAVMSLVRLRQRQATQHAPRAMQHETRTRLAEAHHMLTKIYTWFTEGFDTKDLQEAKALLAELRH